MLFYLSFINCDPVRCCEPFVTLDVADAVLQVAVTFGQIYLQQVSQQVLQIGAEVGGESYLRNTQIFVLICYKNFAYFFHSHLYKKKEFSFKNYKMKDPLKEHSAYLSRYDLFIDLNRLICKERRVTSCHFIDENTECPPVHSFVITLKKKNTFSCSSKTEEKNINKRTFLTQN